MLLNSQFSKIKMIKNLINLKEIVVNIGNQKEKKEVQAVHLLKRNSQERPIKKLTAKKKTLKMKNITKEETKKKVLKNWM